MAQTWKMVYVKSRKLDKMDSYKRRNNGILNLFSSEAKLYGVCVRVLVNKWLHIALCAITALFARSASSCLCISDVIKRLKVLMGFFREEKSGGICTRPLC